jgi:hypothetical protein
VAERTDPLTITAARPDLPAALISLRSGLLEVRLPLPIPGAAEAETARTHALAQLDDYVLPRLARLDAPVLAVIGGSTGAGKSTLANALVGQLVSRPGVLRPTTRSPVLVHHPDDAAWFGAPDKVLPDLPRFTGADGEGDGMNLRLVTAPGLPPGLGLLDAPDIDSVVDANRELADRLLSAADMWVFVTSAARYADAVPWGYLRQAASRSAALAVVLDRVSADAVDEVRADLARMMVAEGLGDAPLFTITEQVLGPDKMLPPEAAAQLRTWLATLAADAEARERVIRQTLAGAVAALLADASAIATAAVRQVSAVKALQADADAAYAAAGAAVREGSGEGSLLRGEVMARWQEFVGTGELLRNLESGVGRLRDRVVAVVTGKPRNAEVVAGAVESSLETLILSEAEKAADTVRRSWQAQPSGRAVLAAHAELTARHDLVEPTRRLVRDWQRGVLELVRTQGADRRTKARVLSFGVNGVGAALMIVVFAQTAGLTGAEIGIAGGTSLVAQRLLEAVFGDQAVRTLSAKARDDLGVAVDALLNTDLARFVDALEELRVSSTAATQLTVFTAAARSAARVAQASLSAQQAQRREATR